MTAQVTWSASSALPMTRPRRRCGFPVRRRLAPFHHNKARVALVSIELKHLRCAEVAERCGSFRRVADLLALKQSNLSRRVGHLEEQLGVALFERTNGGVKPTAAGRDFVNGVRRILNELQIVVDGAKAVGRGEAGYLTIGFYTSLSAGNLRSTLLDYARRFPQVHLATRICASNSGLAIWMRSNDISIRWRTE
jgi:DNA-binding transcriptional LysR family regulator